MLLLASIRCSFMFCGTVGTFVQHMMEMCEAVTQSNHSCIRTSVYQRHVSYLSFMGNVFILIGWKTILLSFL